MTPLALGIIGLHHQHARWYHPLWSQLTSYKLAAIAEADSEFLRSENEFFGCNWTTTNYHELLDSNDIDAVIIWLPHSQMPEAVAAAAAAGKHVIIEKPGCANLGGAHQLAEIAAKHPQVKIATPLCWRNHLVSHKIRELIQAHSIGEITAIEARLNAGSSQRYVRDNQHWMLNASEGGGPMWNLGVHWIDFIRWLTASEPVDICGTCSTKYDQGPTRTIEDSAHALLRFDAGFTAMLDISYGITPSYPGSRDIELRIRGTQGAVVWAPSWQGNTDQVLLVSEQNSPPTQTLTIESPEIAGYCGHMGWSWLESFAASVRNNSAAEANMDDLLVALKCADAFYRSAQTGRTQAI